MSDAAPVLQAPIESVIRQSADVWTLWLKAYFPYHAGQSIAIFFPNDVKKRYYSLCSSPTETGHLAITVKLDPAQALAPLFSRLKNGDTVRIEGPFGKFTLPEAMQGPFYFLAGGSGIAPFRSMIKYLFDTGVPAQTWLFHSTKTSQALIFRPEIKEWLQAHPTFHYVPTVTGPPDGDWAFETGRIGGELLRRHQVQSGGHFFLCGPADFVKDMELLLHAALQVPAGHIRREQW